MKVIKKNIVLVRVLWGVLLGMLLLACSGSSTGGGAVPDIGNKLIGTPVAPANVQVTSGDGSISVRWDAPTGVIDDQNGSPITNEVEVPEVTEYTVYYSEKPITDKNDLSVKSKTVTGTSTVIPGLKNDVQYYVIVTARNAKGEGVASSEVDVTPKTDEVVVGIPVAPTGVQADPGDGSMTVSWTAPTEVTGGGGTSVGITKYTVYYSENSITDKTASGVLSTNTTGTSVTITGLKNDVMYYVIVTAHNAQGEGVASSEVTVTPKLVGIPVAPTDVQAVPGDASMTVSWSIPTEVTGEGEPSAITGYTVYYSKKPITDKTASGVLSRSTTETRVTITGLDNGVQYYIRVAAVNQVGEGVVSPEVTATPKVASEGIINISLYGLSYLTFMVDEGDGTATLEPKWEDLPSRERKLIYSITTRPTDATPANVNINEDTGIISTSEKVEFKDGGSYTVVVRGEGGYSGAQTATFVLKILRLNLTQFTPTVTNFTVEEGVAFSQPLVWTGAGAPTLGDKTGVRYYIIDRPSTSSRNSAGQYPVIINGETGEVSTTQGVDGNDQGVYSITAQGSGTEAYSGLVEDIKFELTVAVDLAKYSLSYSNQNLKISFGSVDTSGFMIIPDFFSQSPKWGPTWNNIPAPPTGEVKYAITKRESTTTRNTEKVTINPDTGVISAEGLRYDDFIGEEKEAASKLTYTITVTPNSKQYAGTQTATFIVSTAFGL